MPANKPKLLCVDDDANILQGFRLHLRQEVDVRVAESGADALTQLRQHRDIAVIVSDMRMPNMDGAEFLSRAKELAPSAVRVLLTGYSDFDAAIQAVNEGQIFRFLSKPCPPDTLKATIAACVEQHRLIRAEKELLNQTLVGCVKVMLDVVGFALPEAQQKAIRIRDRLSRISQANGLKQRWQLELAASFSQLSSLAMLVQNQTSVHSGDMDPTQQARVEAATSRIAKLVESIPRLEPVSELISGIQYAHNAMDKRARLLAAVLRYDELEDKQVPQTDALAMVAEEFDSELAGLVASGLATANAESLSPTSLEELRPGMILAEDLRTVDGMLLVLEGSELDEPTIDHVIAHRQDLAAPALRVLH